MSYESILFDEGDGVATLTLNRPESLNALNAPMFSEISDALGTITKGSSKRVLVLKGAGRAFCSGADMAKGTGTNVGDGPFDAGLVLEMHLNPIIEQIAALPVPVIASVNGAAAGAGCSLALAADLVVAAKSSFFLMAFARVGLVADGGASWVLPRLVGRSRAIELMFLGERLTAEKACEWGMIHQAVEDDALQAATDDLALKLASGPTTAFGLVRQQINHGFSASLKDSLLLERNNQRQAGLTGDHAEGKAAFKEKRAPRFSGH